MKIPLNLVNRRSGVFVFFFSNTKNAEEKLKWKAQKSFIDMCRDSYLFALKASTGK